MDKIRYLRALCSGALKSVLNYQYSHYNDSIFVDLYLIAMIVIKASHFYNFHFTSIVLFAAIT